MVLTPWLLHRLVPSNQSSEIMFAPPQTLLPLLPLPPPSVFRPAEPPSLLQLCLLLRGSEFTLHSRFHHRSGDLPNITANDSLLPRLKTYRRSSDIRFLLIELAVPNYSSIRSAPRSIHRSCQGLLQPMLRPRFTFFPCDRLVTTAWTTTTICHIHPHIYFNSQLPFSNLFTDLRFYPPHTFTWAPAIFILSPPQFLLTHCIYNTHFPLLLARSAPGFLR